MSILPLQLESLTLESLRAMIPEKERGQWEWKSGRIAAGDREPFRKELATQLSAFANSGGGWLVIGLDDDTREPTGCIERIGDKPIDDWVLRVAASLVSFPIAGLRAKLVESCENPSTKALVIEIPDSPSAPHQAVHNHIYYYRNHDESKPADHFYLDLLRRRTVTVEASCDIEISEINSSMGSTTASFKCFLVATNKTNQAATPFGCHVTFRSNRMGCWKVGGDGSEVEWITPVLFPQQTKRYLFWATYESRISDAPEYVIPEAFANLVLVKSVFTQNFSRHDESVRPAESFDFNKFQTLLRPDEFPEGFVEVADRFEDLMRGGTDQWHRLGD